MTNRPVRMRLRSRGRGEHGHHDAGIGSGGPEPPRRHRGRVARDRAGRRGDRQIRRNAALRIRWPDGLSPAADGRGAAGHHRTGGAGSEILLRAGHQGGAARLRHLAVRRRAAAGRRRAARPRQIQAHPRDRFRQPRRRHRTGRDQPCHQPGRGRCRFLLRARSVLADRLLDRRQCGGEFRRRALPEIRHDHQQRARLRNRADVGRNHQDRRQVGGARRLRPDGHHHRFGRPARGHHRDHGADPAEARRPHAR